MRLPLRVCLMSSSLLSSATTAFSSSSPGNARLAAYLQVRHCPRLTTDA